MEPPEPMLLGSPLSSGCLIANIELESPSVTLDQVRIMVGAMEPSDPTTQASDPISPPADDPEGGGESSRRPRYALIAGYFAGGLTLLFFMWLVVLSIRGQPVPCEERFLPIAVLALGTALAFGFIGGSAKAEGTLPNIPGIDSPITFALAGGVAALLVVLSVGWILYADDCPDPAEELTRERASADAPDPSRDSEIRALLDDAWDLMAGVPGAPWIPAHEELTAGERRSLELAHRRIEEALEIAPTDERAREYEAIYLAKTGRIQLAKQRLSELVQASPTYAKAHNGLGNLHFGERNLAMAIDSFREAIRLDPDYVVAYFNLGNALYASEEYRDALESYDEALRRDSSLTYAMENRGNTHVRLNEIEAGIEDYQRAIRAGADRRSVFENLGDALMKAGRLREAVDAYGEALQREPSRSATREKLRAAERALEDPSTDDRARQP